MIITCPNCSTRYSLPQDKIKPEGQKVRCAKCGTVWHQDPEEEPLALTAEEIVPAAPAPAPAWAAAAPAEPAVPPVTASTETIEPEPATPDAAMPDAATPDVTVAAAEAAAVTPGIRPDSFAKFHVPADADEEPSGAGRKIAIAVVVLVVAALGALVVFKQQVQDLTGLQLVATQAPPPATPAAPEAPPKPKPPEPLTLTFEEVESSIEEIDGIKRLLVKGVIVNPADHEQLVPPLAFNMLDKDGKPIDRWTFAAPVRALAPHTTTRFASQRDTPPSSLHELVPGFDVPENPPPVIEPPAAPGAAPAAAAPAAGAPAGKPAATATTPPTPAAPRPPAAQQTPGPIE
jgi:predicted Zn finger-like uncharacterized protein